MITAKNNKVLLLAFLALVVLVAIVYLRGSTTRKGFLTQSCSLEEKIVSIDLEASQYSSDNVATVVGSVAGGANIEKLEYDIVAYKGGTDAEKELYVIKDGVFAPDEGFNLGWTPVEVEKSGEFSLVPAFPKTFSSTMFLGVYFKATCQDGTENGLTRLVIDRHLDGNALYSVSTDNPESSKFFAAEE